MLPKLIVAAVLINLSYFICLLLVDVSNILGNSFQALFNGMGDAVTMSVPNKLVVNADGTEGIISQEAITTGLAGVGLLGAIVGGAEAILVSPMILLSVFVSAIGILISIFFLFILLSTRQAAIIVLIVISPIAVVLYTLPNTKKYFDKCWKLFEGLLLVYPICGLLVGAGDYVSKLLIAVGLDGGKTDFIWVFTAMITGIVPILFIPKVLQDAFAAMGNLGAKITNLGRGLGAGATGAIRGSGAYQHAMNASKMRQARILGGLGLPRDENGNIKKGGARALTNLFAGGNRSRQRYAHQYRRMVEEQGSLASADEAGFMDATLDKMAKEQIVASGMINNIGMSTGKDGKVAIDENGLTAALIKALKENDHSNIRELTNALSTKGDGGRLAVKHAYNTAFREGMSDDAAKVFANNIMNNHAADYKNNDRSMFDVANNITQGKPAKSTTEYVNENKAALAGKVTASTIASMDDRAFGEVFGGYDDAGKANFDVTAAIPDGVSAEMKQQIIASANAALQNSENIKAERRKFLQDIVSSGDVSVTTNSAGVAKPVVEERDSGLIITHGIK